MYFSRDMTRDVSLQPSVWVGHYRSRCLGLQAEKYKDAMDTSYTSVVKFLSSGSTSVKHMSFFYSKSRTCRLCLYLCLLQSVSLCLCRSVTFFPSLSFSLCLRRVYLLCGFHREQLYHRLMNRLAYCFWWCQAKHGTVPESQLAVPLFLRSD